MDQPSFSILIPVYNGQNTLPLLLQEIFSLQNIKPEIVFIVDDGSTDNSIETIKDYSVNLISFKKNGGKGRALKKGFEAFLKHSVSDYILCMDADLQHSAQSIPDFIKNAKDKSSLVTLGKREIQLNKMPVMRFLSNKITTFLLSLLCNQRLSDSQCGYRLIHRSVLKEISLYENGFQLESEFLIRCAEKNIKIDSIKIPTIYNNHGSNIRHLYDSLKFVKLVTEEAFKKWFIPNNAKK